MRAHFTFRKKTIFSFFIFIFCFIITQQSIAQQTNYIYVNGHGGFKIPANKIFSENYSFGAGVDAGAAIAVMNTYLTGKIGYSRFFKGPKGNYAELNYIPVTFGIRHYLDEEYFYVYGDAGFAWISSKSMYATETKFTGGGGLGFKFPSRVELQLGYHGVNGKKPYAWLSWFELKVGYNWAL